MGLGPMEGEGSSTGVGTRGITEEVVGGELGVAEGMGMEEMEVFMSVSACITYVYYCMSSLNFLCIY